MRSQNRKFKDYVPIGSGVFLLLLMVSLVCPVTSAGAWAEEALDGEMLADENASTDADTDAGIMPTADNGVTITFSPTTGSASLTPTTADGSLAKIDVTANVRIASTGGYTIHLGGKNAALTGTKTGATIPGATTATTFNNMKTNTWGYAYAEGSSVPDSATYSALPQGQGKSLKSVSGNNTNINHTYALSFATKIGNDKPADTYSNQVTLSVTSSPLEVTTYSINYDANGGTGSANPSVQTATSADSAHEFTVAAQGTLTKSNHQFLGWAESASAATATYTASVSKIQLSKLNPSLTLYAVWKPATKTVYSVTYKHASGSSTGTLPEKQEAESYNDSHTFTAPEKPDNLKDSCEHQFTGWSPLQSPHYINSPEYPAGSSITLTKDNPSIILYPKFKTGNWC